MSDNITPENAGDKTFISYPDQVFGVGGDELAESYRRTEKRETVYVTLKFVGGDRHDYEPPLPHPADVFLERLEHDEYFRREVGAIDGWTSNS